VVRAVGLSLEGRLKTDIVGMRRVITPNDIGVSTEVISTGALMRRAENTDLQVVPTWGGMFAVGSQGASGGRTCPAQVMINGDRRRFMPFTTFDRMHGASDIEAIEIFPYSGRVPFSYQPPRAGCGLLVVWLKNA
jgi:hypothetical protein